MGARERVGRGTESGRTVSKMGGGKVGRDKIVRGTIGRSEVGRINGVKGGVGGDV